MAENSSKAVFLDRDGVINDGTLYYTYRPADFKLNSGVTEGLLLLQDAGYKLIVVTNQGGVAKGEYSEADIAATHAYMLGLLADAGICIAGVYYCPHHSDVAPCTCRKPAPGMLLSAIAEHGIDPEQSFLIGDSKRDIEAAEAAGVKGIKISKNENILPHCQQILSACPYNMPL